MIAKKPIYIVVTPFFPRPESWRGAFCYDFVRALQRLDKYDVRVFVHWRSGEGTCNDYEYHGIKVYRFRFVRAPYGFAPFLFDASNRRSFLKKAQAAGIDWGRVAVYHAHDIVFSSYVEGMKKKYPNITSVLHFHNMGHPFHLSTGKLGVIPIYSTFQYLWLRRRFERIDLPVFVSKRQCNMFGRWYPDGFLGNSESVLKRVWLGRFVRPIRLKEPYILYNGIDYSIFNSKGRRLNDSNRFTIGFVANMCVSKDPMTLLRALKILKDDPDMAGLRGWKCIFVGSGTELLRCQRYAHSNALEQIAEFKVEMDHLELPDFYRSLDLFVLPSWAEGFGCAFVEAHGCGVPIIGCKGVSVDECFPPEEQERWLAVPNNATSLAEKIKWFYMQRAKQVFVDDFDIDKLVRKYDERVGTGQ